MKVTFVCPYIYPLFDKSPKFKNIVFGGAEVQLFLIGTTLSSISGYQVSYVSADFGQNSVFKYYGINVFKSFPLRETHKKTGLFKKVLNVIKLFFVLHKANTDCLVQRNSGAETGVVALYAKLFHKKFIYMVSSDIDCNGTYCDQTGLSGKMFFFGLRHADCIVVQSENQKKLLLNNYGINSIVVKTGYKMDSLASNRKDMVLWVGRICDVKQPLIFLEIAKLLPSVKFVMIAPQSCTDLEYDRFMQKIQPFSNLEYFSYVAFSEIDDFFKRAYVVVNTSRFEGFPNTYVQAFKHGVPVAALNVNPDKILTDKKLGFCNSDMNKLTEFIRTLVADLSIQKKYADTCFEYSRKNHDIENNVLKFKEVLDGI